MLKKLILFKILLISCLLIPCSWAINQANPNIFSKSLANQSFVWSDDTDKLSGQHKYLLSKKYQQNPNKQKLGIQFLKDSAGKGYADAQYDLGMKFFKGEKLNKNLLLANKWLTKAASQEHVKAQFQLGLMYQNGEGVKRNTFKAIKYLHKAAENGHGGAQHALAINYMTQNKNIEQALFWLQKSVQQNNSDAQRDLGYLYYQGLGTKKDYRQAVALLSEPASQGNPMSQFLLGEIYAEGGYGIGQQRDKSLNWYKQALRSGYSDAQIAMNKLHNKDKSQTSEKSRSFVVASKITPKPKHTSKKSDFKVNQLYQWKNAWEQKDVNSYLDFYSKKFRGKKRDYRGWVEYRRKVIGKSDNIRIKLGNIKTEIKNSKNIVVSFNQYYQSNNYSDKVYKRQYWQKEGDSHWRIVREYSN